MASQCFACISPTRLQILLFWEAADHGLITSSTAIFAAGINVEHLPYVSVIEATALKVQPVGQESSWNVDGELMPHNQLSAKVCQAAAQAFSRGIESADTVIRRPPPMML